MRNMNVILAISLSLALAACADHDGRETAPVDVVETPPDASTSYLGYVQKMIAATDDTEDPWTLEGITAEAIDDQEAVEIN